MKTRRINRYIFLETLTPTLLGLIVFTFILVMGRLPSLAELVVNKGVPLTSILKLFSYLLPTFLSITIPLSFLLGILLAFGRLSSDNEFIALKSTGISLYTLVIPILSFSILCVLVTGGLTLFGEPFGKAAFRDQIFTMASDRATIGIQGGVFNEGGVFNASFKDLVIYAEEMDDKRELMTNVFISDERADSFPATIFAREGQFIHNPQRKSITLRLRQGTIHHLTPSDTGSYQTIGFNTYDINFDFNTDPNAKATRSISLGEYTPGQLIRAQKTAPDQRQRTRMAVELHKRISTSAAPLVFALIGIPLGLQSNRSGKGAGFAIALGIALCYYVLLNVAGTLASKGLVPPAIALYLPNLLFVATGLFFIHRTAIERPLTFPRIRVKRLFSSKTGAQK